MDYFNGKLPQEDSNLNSPPPLPNGMARTALVLGAVSILSIVCVYPAFILGGIAIILAILSRGNERKIEAQAKLGMILSCVSIVFSIYLFISSILYIYQNPEIIKDYLEIYEQMYGEDMSEPFEQMFPGVSIEAE